MRLARSVSAHAHSPAAVPANTTNPCAMFSRQMAASCRASAPWNAAIARAYCPNSYRSLPKLFTVSKLSSTSLTWHEQAGGGVGWRGGGGARVVRGRDESTPLFGAHASSLVSKQASRPLPPRLTLPSLSPSREFMRLRTLPRHSVMANVCAGGGGGGGGGGGVGGWGQPTGAASLGPPIHPPTHPTTPTHAHPPTHPPTHPRPRAIGR